VPMNTIKLKFGGLEQVIEQLAGQADRLGAAAVEASDGIDAMTRVIGQVTSQITKLNRKSNGQCYLWYASRVVRRIAKPVDFLYFTRDGEDRKPGWYGNCTFGWFRSRRLLKKAMKKAGCWPGQTVVKKGTYGVMVKI